MRLILNEVSSGYYVGDCTMMRDVACIITGTPFEMNRDAACYM
jgi:hypothetical protein